MQTEKGLIFILYRRLKGAKQRMERGSAVFYTICYVLHVDFAKITGMVKTGEQEDPIYLFIQ